MTNKINNLSENEVPENDNIQELEVDLYMKKDEETIKIYPTTKSDSVLFPDGESLTGKLEALKGAEKKQFCVLKSIPTDKDELEALTDTFADVCLVYIEENINSSN